MVLTSLKSLDLTENPIGPEGVQALMKLSSLTRLTIGSNHINDEDAQVFSNLTSLTYLDVRANDIGYEGVRALMKLTSLTYLDLSENNIGEGGNQILRERVINHNLKVHFHVKSLYHILLEYAVSKNLQCDIVDVQRDSTDSNIIQRCEGLCEQLKTNLQPCLLYSDLLITCKRVCCHECMAKYVEENCDPSPYDPS